MIKFFSALIVIAACCGFNVTTAQPFNGKIEYTISENYVNRAFCTYFFNGNYIKKIDTSGSLFVAAGFSETIWDLKNRKQYLINHGNKTIYFSDYVPDSAYDINSFSQTPKIDDNECLKYEKSERKSVVLKDKEDTIVHNSTFFVAKELLLSSRIKSEGKYDPLNLSSGYIPLRIKNWGGLISSENDSYNTLVEAVKIKEKNIGDDFFNLPEGYQTKVFVEIEIRDMVRKAAEKRIDFMEMAKKVMREKGMFSIFD